jgi:hypothetical protein
MAALQPIQARFRRSHPAHPDLRRELHYPWHAGPGCSIIQHVRILQRLEEPDFAYSAMRPITVTVAIMLLLMGAFGFVGILL